MADASLKVILSADGQQLSSTLKKTGKDVESLGSDLKKIPPDLGRVNSNLDNTSRKLATAGNAVKKSKTDLTNWSRVIQDLPFGLIGIQNNLTQLIPGVGLLGLAFSGLISALTFSQVGLSNWIRGSNAAKAAGSALAQSIGGAKDEYVKATSQVATLLKEIDLAKKGFIDKDKVVKEYNDSIGKTTGFVKSLEEAEQALQKNAAAYIQFTLLKAAANIALGKAAEKAFEIQEQINNATRGNTSQDVQITARFQAGEAQRAAQLAGKSGAEQAKAYNDAFNLALAQGKAGKEIAAKKQFEAIGQQLLTEAAELSKKFKFNFFGDPGTAKEDIIAKAKEVAAFLKNAFVVDYVFSPLDSKEVATKKAQAFLDEVSQGLKIRTDLFSTPNSGPLAQFEQIKKVLSSFEDGLQKGVIEGPKVEFPDSGFINEYQIELLSRYNDKFKEIGRSVFQLSSVDLFKVNAEGLQKILDQMTNIKRTSEAIADVLGSAIDNVYEAIKKGTDPIKAFFTTVQSEIEKFIKQLFIAAVKALLIRALIGGGEGGASFGEIFKGLLLGKAEGGPVFANRPYVVGERGPELFIPQGGGRIIPNNEMNSGLAGITTGAMGFVAETRLTGKDIALLISRVSQSQNRNF